MARTVHDLEVKRLVHFEGEGSLKAYCDLAIGDVLLVHGFRVIEGKQGLFVSMPRQAGKDGRWYDSVVPLTTEARAALQQVILKAYQQPDPTTKRKRRVKNG